MQAGCEATYEQGRGREYNAPSSIILGFAPSAGGSLGLQIMLLQISQRKLRLTILIQHLFYLATFSINIHENKLHEFEVLPQIE